MNPSNSPVSPNVVCLPLPSHYTTNNTVTLNCAVLYHTIFYLSILYYTVYNTLFIYYDCYSLTVVGGTSSRVRGRGRGLVR